MKTADELYLFLLSEEKKDPGGLIQDRHLRRAKAKIRGLIKKGVEIPIGLTNLITAKETLARHQKKEPREQMNDLVSMWDLDFPTFRRLIRDSEKFARGIYDKLRAESARKQDSKSTNPLRGTGTKSQKLDAMFWKEFVPYRKNYKTDKDFIAAISSDKRLKDYTKNQIVGSLKRHTKKRLGR